ncbi:MAG: AraC family transcriptional regulator [Cyanobacteria bacterium REEB459]|nr:AraC family transcriptional regulator [Cyanobacteria bacterium REEB459]
MDDNLDSIFSDPGLHLKACDAKPSPPTPISLGQELTMVRYEGLPAGNLPEICFADHHVLTVLDPESAAIFEEKIGNRSYPRRLKGHGSVTLVPAGVNHQACWEQPITLTIFHFHRSLFDQGEGAAIEADQPTLIPQQQISDATFCHLMLALQSSLLATPLDASSDSYNQALLAMVVRRLVTHHSTCPPVHASGALPPASLNKILAYIDTCLETDIQITDLASLVNLSVTDLRQGFEASMGLSLTSYLHQQRCQRIQRLLQTMQGQGPSPVTLPAAAPYAGPAFEPILNWLNQRIQEATGRCLTDTQTRIVTGVLQGQQYQQIAAQYQQSQGHLKTVAAELWLVLSQAVGEPVRKSNLRSYLQRQGLWRP